VRYHLIASGQTDGFFGNVLESGWHERSIQLVRSGKVDASAIDSHVLAVAFRDDSELAFSLRIIDSLGPSTIQPVVASCRLPQSLRRELRSVLIEMGGDPLAKEHLASNLVAWFVSIGDGDYYDIRQMLAVAEQTGFLTLR
jgi:phosphonate transport system substrate-binding protein